MPKSSSLVLLFILLILLQNNPSTHCNNETDYEALLAFKKAIRDDPLDAMISWNQTNHFCRWNGVSCSKRHPNRVVSLSLRHQRLAGFLPPHIGNLSFLRHIDLINNSFHGYIPEEMGRLTRLRVIVFSNNYLEGGIPRNLSRCRNLWLLNLIDNRLTGSIVPEMASLVNLEMLGLSVNMLSGTIPPFFGNLTSLTVLSIANCGMQGEIPESLVQLRRLRFLTLMQNDLTGRIPPGLFNLSNIKTLALSFNRLVGTIPSDIGFTLLKLSVLSVSDNYFTGSLPTFLSNSSEIIKLLADYNNFTGEMIDVARLSSLEHLGLMSNNLKGDVNTILLSLTNCTALQTVGLGDNLFTGSLPDSIGNLSLTLWALSIHGNQLSGSIPSSIGNLFGLTYLNVGHNDLQGPIPSSIGRLEKLQIIYLHSNNLQNEIPFSLGNLTLLNYLDLFGNYLSGSIPPTLGNCSNLLWLDLSQNSLNGSIPPEIMRLSSISILLGLSHNVLMGNIPLEVGALRNLETLDLSHNRLSGLLPTSLSSCVTLQILRLDHNSLTGEITESLSALKGLQNLDLSQNNFTGTIPSFLANLLLLNLNLSFNSLSGEVPTRGVFLNASAVTVEGNRKLCGGFASLDLPPCSSMNSSKTSLRKILIPIVAAVSLALSACLFFIIYRRWRSQHVQRPDAMFKLPEFLRLSYADLLNATDGFSETNLLGAGRFGSVYRGGINDDKHSIVAVKVFNLDIGGACKSLASECNALRGIKHRNLLKILSVCDSIDFQGGDFKALVYEFMANRSLENWLHQDCVEEGRFLSTIQRLDIGIDIASAVEYLHYGTDSTVIHGDLRPANILLDEDLVAHVGDFGLAKIISSVSGNLPSSDGSLSTAIRGTIGYIPPEYGTNNVISTQGDAYSYGVLLLEMFTNVRPTNDEFVKLQDFLPDRVMEVVDPFLHEELNQNEEYKTCIVSVLSIGVRCSKQLPRDRMSMAQVVIELKKIRDVFVAIRNLSSTSLPRFKLHFCLLCLKVFKHNWSN